MADEDRVKEDEKYDDKPSFKNVKEKPPEWSEEDQRIQDAVEEA